MQGFLSGLGVRVDEDHRTEPTWKHYLDGFPIPLPLPRVAPGETWIRTIRITVHGVTLDATATGTLERVERSGDERIARLRIRTETRGRGRPFTGLPSTVSIERSATFRSITEVAWSVERNRITTRVFALSPLLKGPQKQVLTRVNTLN